MRNIDYVVYVAKYYKTETESAWYRLKFLLEFYFVLRKMQILEEHY